MVTDECDYLVVGAGTSGMSFIDTLLTEKPNTSVILVDRNAKPGGHWTTAYPFVQLNQHNCFYGVNSLPLGKKFDRRGNAVFDYADRATGEEVLQYYEKVLEKFRTKPNFKVHFGCEYRQEESSTASSSCVHSIRSSDGDIILICCKKLVMIHTKVIVPSMRKVPFPVHEDVNYIIVNDTIRAKMGGKYTHYVVLGAGKTSLDTIIQLLKLGVDQSSIKWVISQDVWYFIREKLYPKGKTHYENLSTFVDTCLAVDSGKDFLLKLEDIGLAARLDPHRDTPTIMKGALISSDDLSLLRTVKDIVRLGRVKSIEAGGIMMFGSDDEGLQEVHLSSDNKSTVFVDCMSENFYGYTSFSKDFKIFEPNRINLGPLLVVLNPSLSAALIAYMEAKISDDETKNACCFWGTSKNSIEYFFESFYGQIKTFIVLMKTYPRSGRFILYSRTNVDSVIYHGGLMKFLWAQFGPRQLKVKVGKMIERMEFGEYNDFQIQKEFITRTIPPAGNSGKFLCWAKTKNRINIKTKK